MTGTVRFPLGQVAITANASLRLATEEVIAKLRWLGCGNTTQHFLQLSFIYLEGASNT